MMPKKTYDTNIVNKIGIERDESIGFDTLSSYLLFYIISLFIFLIFCY